MRRVDLKLFHGLVRGLVFSGIVTAWIAAQEELYVEGQIASYLARDMDGDGNRELWVAYHRDRQRFLAFFQGGASYSRAPTRVIPLDPRAILYGAGDYGASAGAELVLLSRASGSLIPLTEGATGQRMFKANLFFNMPSGHKILPWLSGEPLDVNGDGLEDFVVPERNQLRLMIQAPRDRGEEVAWAREVRLPIPYYLLVDSRQERITKEVARFAELARDDEAVLSAAGAYPYPAIQDFDGDGLRDVIVRRPRQFVEVYRQLRSGEFELQQLGQLPWMKGVAGLILADVNGDGQLDFVSSKLLLKELTTEIKVFLQDRDSEGMGFKKPQQVLKVSGFFRRPALGDVDGDRRPDLLVASYRVDLLEQLSEETVAKVEISYQVFLAGKKSTFGRVPVFRRVFTLPTANVRHGQTRPSLYFGRDVNGDRLSDVMFIDRGRWLRLYTAVPGKNVEYEEAKAFATRVTDPEHVALVDLDGKSGSEVILRYERSLRVHRYRP